MNGTARSIVGGAGLAVAAALVGVAAPAGAQDGLEGCPLEEVRIGDFVWDRQALVDGHLGEPSDITGEPLTEADLNYLFDNAYLEIFDADGNLVYRVDDPVPGEGYSVPPGGYVDKCQSGEQATTTTTTTTTPGSSTTTTIATTTSRPPQASTVPNTSGVTTLPEAGASRVEVPFVVGLIGLGAGGLLILASRRRSSTPA